SWTVNQPIFGIFYVEPQHTLELGTDVALKGRLAGISVVGFEQWADFPGSTLLPITTFPFGVRTRGLIAAVDAVPVSGTRIDWRSRVTFFTQHCVNDANAPFLTIRPYTEIDPVLLQPNESCNQGVGGSLTGGNQLRVGESTPHFQVGFANRLRFGALE